MVEMLAVNSAAPIIGHFKDLPARKNCSLDVFFLYPAAIPTVMMPTRYTSTIILSIPAITFLLPYL